MLEQVLADEVLERASKQNRRGPGAISALPSDRAEDALDALPIQPRRAKEGELVLFQNAPQLYHGVDRDLPTVEALDRSHVLAVSVERPDRLEKVEHSLQEAHLVRGSRERLTEVLGVGLDRRGGVEDVEQLIEIVHELHRADRFQRKSAGRDVSVQTRGHRAAENLNGVLGLGLLASVGLEMSYRQFRYQRQPHLTVAPEKQLDVRPRGFLLPKAKFVTHENVPRSSHQTCDVEHVEHPLAVRHKPGILRGDPELPRETKENRRCAGDQDVDGHADVPQLGYRLEYQILRDVRGTYAAVEVVSYRLFPVAGYATRHHHQGPFR